MGKILHCEHGNLRTSFYSFLLLIFSYPTIYLNTQFRKFLTEHNIYDSQTSILPIITQERDFFNIRQRLITLPTRRQSQVAKQINLSQIEYYDNTVGQEQILIQSILTKDPKEQKSTTALFQHYTYEHRLRFLTRQLHEIYQNTFNNIILQQINLIVGCRNNPKLKDELIKHKRPLDRLRAPDNI